MELTDDMYLKLGQRVIADYTKDEAERASYLTTVKEAIKLANQTVEEKTFPWRGASNIKLPMIADAAIKFAARAYGEMVPSNQVVKTKIFADNPQKAERAERVKTYMNFQLLEKEENWEADTDQLLHMVAVVGHMFRKRFYCPFKQRQDSEIIMPDMICCSKDGRRKTHIHPKITESEVVARQRSGEWRDIELSKASNKEFSEEQECYEMLEMHGWFDLDEDGYEEPYIVVVEKESGKVLKVEERFEPEDINYNDEGEIFHIEPTDYIIDYCFLPALDGGYYCTGFGQLLMPLSMSANSLINQLVDAGTLNNVQGGFLSDKVKILSGRQNFEIGEWKKVQTQGTMNSRLADNVLPLPTKEPSGTLFSLLGLLIDLTKDLGSVKDVLAGDAPAANVPATTVVALIEQGMKTFNTIYKRLYRSLKKEFQLLYKLNGQYMDFQEYVELNDEQHPVFKMDFDRKGLDVLPQANPEMSTDVQRLAKAEALKQLIGAPGVDPRPILTMWLEALRIDKEMIDQILPPPPENPQPAPEVMQMMQELEIKQAEIQLKERELAIKEAELGIKQEKQDVDRLKGVTDALKNVATAEQMEKGQQLNEYRAITEGINARLETQTGNQGISVPASTGQAGVGEGGTGPQT